MKEIKAYIRREKAEDVMHALEGAGVPGFTAIEVKAMGENAPCEGEKFSIDYAEKYCCITKIEAVCRDTDVERIADVIRKSAYTGHRGDGMIFATDVCLAVKIRTGQSGEEALKG